VQFSLEVLEPLPGLLGRETRHDAEEFIAPETYEEIVGAHVASESFDHVLNQLVAGVMAVLIVDGLETVNVHVRRDERFPRAVGAVNLALQILKPNAAPARAGQLVGSGLLAVEPGRLAITLTELAVDGGQRSVVFRTFAAERSQLATLDVVGTPDCQRPSAQQPVHPFTLERCRVVGLRLLVAAGSEFVALLCRLVAVASALVAAMRDQRLLGRPVRTVRGWASVKPALMLGDRHATVCDPTAGDR
jgi:endogenous inhibitor of DNA gyrase (YacG/DUF329 family)